MKYTLNESKLEKVIYDYIDSLFPEDETYSGYVEEYDENADETLPNKNNFQVYDGEYETLIYWYGKDYFYAYTEQGRAKAARCPMIVLRSDLREKLEDAFGDFWKYPMKKWFEDRFNIPVRTVE